MAAGGPEPIGYAAFAVVKAIGYTLAAKQFRGMSRLRPEIAPNALAVGLTRTLVGIAVGYTYGYAWLNLGGGVHNFSPALYYAFLFPIRLMEWSVVLWMFFGKDVPLSFYAKTTLLGTLYSYGLDLVAVLTLLIVPGGIWIC